MPRILHIETATEICSVTVSDGSEVIFEKIENAGMSHATHLGVFVDEAVRYLRSEGLTLDAVAVSCGPGSYTGLRIGVSEAKGLCYGLRIPLIAIETLRIMAWGVVSKKMVDDDTLLCPMIDARRMEVYDAIYNVNMVQLRDTTADIIDADSFSNLLSDTKIAFFGNGAAKCGQTLTSVNALFIENIHPLASDMIGLANAAFEQGEFVDLAYFEPFYLKDFVATTPKNKVLGGC